MKSNEHNEPHDPESPSVEIRVIGGTASPAWNVPEEAEEVIRLEKTPPEIRRSVEDVGPALPEAPRQGRGHRKRVSQRQLTFAMAGGVALLAILAMVRSRLRAASRSFSTKSDEHDAPDDPELPSVEIRAIGGADSPIRNAPEEAEEVIRRQKRLPEICKSVEDVGPALPEAPRQGRGHRRRVSQRQLTFAMAGGVALLTILAVVGLRFRDDAASGEQVPYLNVAVSRSAEPTSLDRFSESAQDYLQRAQEKARRYLAAEQVADVLPLIRDGARWKKLLSQQWQPLRMEHEKVDHLQMEFGEREEGSWFTLNGEDEDGEQVQLVFFPNGNEVDMDWAASFGVGDMPFGHLDRLAVSDEVDMRVIVSSDNYFNLSFPEDDYLCFKLEARFQEDWVWGYAPVGSSVASELVRLLWQDSYILDARERVMAILTMSKNEMCGRRQFEIRQLVTERWVDSNERE